MSKDDRFSNRPNVRQAEVPPIIETATLRDQFAMAALIALGPAAATRPDDAAVIMARMAGFAFEIADKMMLARNA